MSKLDYWRDCLAESFDEAGVTVTAEQLDLIAGNVDGASSEYGSYSYQPSDPMLGEISRLEKALKAERNKVGCGRCGGSGREQYYAGSWAVDTQCGSCHGEGKVAA